MSNNSVGVPAGNNVEGNEAIASTCAICQYDIALEQEKKNFCSCNHPFHKICLDNWLNRDRRQRLPDNQVIQVILNSCPTCRAEHDDVNCKCSDSLQASSLVDIHARNFWRNDQIQSPQDQFGQWNPFSQYNRSAELTYKIAKEFLKSDFVDNFNSRYQRMSMLQEKERQESSFKFAVNKLFLDLPNGAFFLGRVQSLDSADLFSNDSVYNVYSKYIFPLEENLYRDLLKKILIAVRKNRSAEVAYDQDSTLIPTQRHDFVKMSREMKLLYARISKQNRLWAMFYFFSLLASASGAYILNTINSPGYCCLPVVLSVFLLLKFLNSVRMRKSGWGSEKYLRYGNPEFMSSKFCLYYSIFSNPNNSNPNLTNFNLAV